MDFLPAFKRARNQEDYERRRISVGAVYDRTIGKVCAVIDRTYSRKDGEQSYSTGTRLNLVR